MSEEQSGFDAWGEACEAIQAAEAKDWPKVRQMLRSIEERADAQWPEGSAERAEHGLALARIHSLLMLDDHRLEQRLALIGDGEWP